MVVKKKETDMKNDERIAVLENTSSHLLDSIARIENKLMYMDNKIDSRFSEIESRFRQLDSKMDEGFKNINNRIWSNFFWKLGAFATLLAVMAHGFHWI